MAHYSLVVAIEGDSIPIRQDGSAFRLQDGERTYSIANQQHISGGGIWVSIEPVEGADHREAYQAAASVLNGCFNLLASRHKHLSSLQGGYLYRNIDDAKDRGSADLVQFTELAFGMPEFPSGLKTDGGCRSAAYYRRALTCEDPLDKVRYLCLAIEESGKKLKAAAGKAKGGEGRVILDSIIPVFKKMSSIDELKKVRESISESMFSPEFRHGQVDAAMNDFLYQHVRCLVMHAGPTTPSGSEFVKDTYAPYDPDDRRKALEVVDVVQRIAELYVLYDLQVTLGDGFGKVGNAKKKKKK